MLEGAIRSQVNDGPVITWQAGQSFSELPGDRHVVSANASDTQAARLLAVLVVDSSETVLMLPLANRDLIRFQKARDQGAMAYPLA